MPYFNKQWLNQEWLTEDFWLMVSQEIKKTLPTGLKWWVIRLKLLLLFIFNAVNKLWQTEYLVDHNQVAVQMITWIQSSRDLKFTMRKPNSLLIISTTSISWSKLIQKEKLKKFLNSYRLLLKNWIDKENKKSILIQKIKLYRNKRRIMIFSNSKFYYWILFGHFYL